MTFVVIKGANASVDVKRLPKKPAPARFGRKLSSAQKARASHLSVDCGCERGRGGARGEGGRQARTFFAS